MPPLDLPAIRLHLARMPDQLEALVAGLPEAWLHANEGPDTFSPWEVAAHLLHGEDTDWMPRIRLILTSGDTIPFTVWDRFEHRTRFAGWPIGKVLEEFRRLRTANLTELSGLPLTEADFDRKGKHQGLGSVTLGQLLSSWVVHDLGHLRQITRVLAKQWGDAVGPWRAYLPVLGEGPN